MVGIVHQIWVDGWHNRPNLSTYYNTVVQQNGGRSFGKADQMGVDNYGIFSVVAYMSQTKMGLHSVSIHYATLRYLAVPCAYIAVPCPYLEPTLRYLVLPCCTLRYLVRPLHTDARYLVVSGAFVRYLVRPLHTDARNIIKHLPCPSIPKSDTYWFTYLTQLNSVPGSPTSFHDMLCSALPLPCQSSPYKASPGPSLPTKSYHTQAGKSIQPTQQPEGYDGFRIVRLEGRVSL